MEHLSKKILITGINGFTGKYLVKYLQERSYDVYGISNNIDEDNLNNFKCNITDKNELITVLKKIQPNYIIHLAAISFVQHQNIDEIYKVNVIGTQNLLEASLEVKENLIKIIIASSATVYGNQDSVILDENLCPNPLNHYGISKLAMEFVTKTYFQKLPIIITRPFNYTAPGHGEQFVIPKIAKAFVNKHENLELGNLNVYREYNAINFVCEVYYKLMLSEVTSEIVNIASGKTHSLNEIIMLFEQATNHKLTIKVNPEFVRKDEIERLSGSTVKLNKIIKSTFNYSIRDVIKSFIDS